MGRLSTPAELVLSVILLVNLLVFICVPVGCALLDYFHARYEIDHKCSNLRRKSGSDVGASG